MVIAFLTSLCSLANVTTALLFFVVAYLSWKFIACRNLPPGPYGLPVIGYLPFLGTKPLEQTLLSMSKKYGNIISLFFGSQLVIVLNSFDVIKEAYVKQGENFAGKPQNLKFREEDTGIAISEGDLWREHRKFILSTFRDYGMGKLSMEPRISEEVHYYLEGLAKENGEPYDVMDLVAMSTQNVISTLEFGKRFDYNDEKFIRLRQLQNDVNDNFPIFPVSAFFPWVKFLPFYDRLTNQKKFFQGQDKLMEFIASLTAEHKAEYEENSRKDLIDAYITERMEIIRKTGNEGHFNEAEIHSNLGTLFAAGAETTATILRWAYLIMMVYPEMQKKVHEEIDNVIGMERTPSISDKSQMVYTEAFLMEIHRFGSINPIGLPHSNIEDTELYGYRIPKRSLIITNEWAVHFDPDLWEEPHRFMPERFITKEGKLRKPEYLIPFGLGKRICLGESLSKMETFLYFTGTMQRFNLQPPPGTTAKLDIDMKGIARRPLPYKFCAIQRKGYSI